MHGRRQRARRVLQLRLEDVHGQISPGEEAVSWDKRRKLWQAQIGQEGSNKHLGHFVDPKDAARAYDAAALERDPISMSNAKLGLLAGTTEREA
jgi:hypothetical protein